MPATTTTTTAVASDSTSSALILPGTRSASVGATIAAVATRTLRKYRRSPQLLVMWLGSGAIFITLFRYIFGGAIDFGTVDYVDFLIPGMVLTSVLITGAGTAAGVAEDIDEGFFDRLRSLPVSRTALLAGRALGDTVIMAWGTAITAAIGFLVGFRLDGSVSEALLAFGLCVVCGFAFTWPFICMGLVAGTAQGAQGMSMLIYPFIFMSTAYVQVDTLPGWMQPLAENSPVTVMCNAVRSLALGDPAVAGLEHTTAYWVVLSLIWAAGIVVAFTPLAVARYRRGA